MNDVLHPIVVIGLSAGGLEPLIRILEDLDADLPISILIVQHIPAHVKSNLAAVLNDRVQLPVVGPITSENLRPGTVYVAQADHHLMVENHQVIVTRGPKENRFRPSVDTLFRSAAYHHRQRVIGVILSGALNDGSSGAWTIKRFGGRVIVQDPEEAIFPDMPRGAMNYVEVDAVLPAAEIGKLLGQWCVVPVAQPETTQRMDNEKLTELEIRIARGEDALSQGVIDLGTPSSLTCPECSGAMTEYQEGHLKRYRCHTGHSHTAESLLAGIESNIETSLWKVMRGMEEGILMLTDFREKLKQQNDYARSAQCEDRIAILRRRSQLIKELIFHRTRVDNPIRNVNYQYK